MRWCRSRGAGFDGKIRGQPDERQRPRSPVTARDLLAVQRARSPRRASEERQRGVQYLAEWLAAPAALPLYKPNGGRRYTPRSRHAGVEVIRNGGRRSRNGSAAGRCRSSAEWCCDEENRRDQGARSASPHSLGAVTRRPAACSIPTHHGTRVIRFPHAPATTSPAAAFRIDEKAPLRPQLIAPLSYASPLGFSRVASG